MITNIINKLENNKWKTAEINGENSIFKIVINKINIKKNINYYWCRP